MSERNEMIIVIDGLNRARRGRLLDCSGDRIDRLRNTAKIEGNVFVSNERTEPLASARDIAGVSWIGEPASSARRA